ncbi:hypothetical protein F5B18DRAFT_411084 [Nemania serpens]|nr:hypothetical protein F5B18DRAFT_411084 [Nemania serpens]
MTSSSCPLLQLPRELRDAIYEHYVIVEGGYIYDFKTGKLRPANDPEHPIDLAFMYTCSRVADEMKGIALRANTITFRTFYSPEMSFRAVHFDNILEECLTQSAYLIGHEDYDIRLDLGEPYIRYDKHVFDEVLRVFPKCQPLLQLARIVEQESPPYYNQEFMDLCFLLMDGNETGWGEVPSAEREIARYAVEVALKLGGYSLSWRRSKPFGIQAKRRYTIQARDLLEIQSTLMPWTIPTEDELTYAIRKSLKPTWQTGTVIGKKCYFSAAAVAIQFLHETAASTRRHLRKIVIHEDHVSVAHPECHAKGLVPFCRENPFLYIERRLDLWHTALCSFERMDWVALQAELSYFSQGSPNMFSGDVARWLVEAVDLFRTGMPEKSFRLVFDGNAAPEKASRVFQRLQRDAAWQEALEEACVRNLILVPSLCAMRESTLYVREHFPRILRDITHQSLSFIQCNFDIGSPCDIESIIDQNRNRPAEDWGDDWWEGVFEDQWELDREQVELYSPFQSWRDAFIEEYIQEDERWRFVSVEGSYPTVRIMLDYLPDK